MSEPIRFDRYDLESFVGDGGAFLVDLEDVRSALSKEGYAVVRTAGAHFLSADGHDVPSPWVVCGDPPNSNWYEGITIGSADPRDGRRVADAMSPAIAKRIVECVNAKVGEP